MCRPDDFPPYRPLCIDAPCRRRVEPDTARCEAHQRLLIQRVIGGKR